LGLIVIINVDKTIQKAELPLIEKIIRDEAWFLGEIRGSGISHDDPELIERVALVILNYGEEMRQVAISGQK